MTSKTQTECRIVFKQDRVDKYQVQVRRLYQAAGTQTAMVTDLSQVSDFFCNIGQPDPECDAYNAEVLAGVEELMAREVDPSEYLADMAEELYNKIPYPNGG